MWLHGYIVYLLHHVACLWHMYHITLQSNFPKSQKVIRTWFHRIRHSVQQEYISDLKQENEGYATTTSKWFQRLKTKLGFGRGHDFHSYRYHPAKNANIPPVIAGELLGHVQNSITYDRYGKQVDIHVLNHAINILKIESTTTSKFTL